MRETAAVHRRSGYLLSSLLFACSTTSCVAASTPDADAANPTETTSDRTTTSTTAVLEQPLDGRQDDAIVRVLLVEQLTLVGDDTVEAIVARPCGERTVELAETGDEVELRILDVWSPGPNEACDSELVLETELVTLARPLAGRNLVIEVPVFAFEGASKNDPCFIRPTSPVCKELVLSHEGERRTVDAWPIGQRPIELDASDGPTLIELSNDWALEVEADVWPDIPIVVNRRTIFEPLVGINGSVVVHNVERDLAALEPADDVAGFPSYSIKGAGETSGPIRGVTIDTGNWLIDVVVFANPPATHSDLLAQLLNALAIETRAGQMPLVADQFDWIRDLNELTVSDLDQRGFTISFALNCEEDAVSCRPGVGYVGPGGGYESTVSEVPPARWSRSALEDDPADETVFDDESLAVDDVVVSITSFGERYPLLECPGIPWYDPALQPKGMTFVDAEYENWQQSGIRDWTWRHRPGEVSGHTGPASDPEAVVRFSEVDDGVWDVVSATRCQ